MRRICRTLPLFLTGLAAVAFTPALALAHPHPAPHAHGGLVEGLAHPLFGLDHLLAMAAVGLLAARLGGRALWMLPAAFVGAMILGGLAGMSGLKAVSVEMVIAASVALLGAAVAFGRPRSIGAAATLAILFGLYHGHAHGAEMPALAQPALYAAGFVASSAAIHLAGVLAGRSLLQAVVGERRMQLAGGAIAAIGCCLVVAAAL